MRRPTAAVIGTVAGVCLLLGAKLGTRAHADLGTVVAPPPGDDSTGAGPDGSPDPSAAATAAATSRPSAGPAGNSTATAAGRPPATSSAPGAPAPGAGSGLRTGTFTGVKVTHKYGTMQVTITVSNGKITDAKASYTTSSQLSSQITGDAVPKLRQQTLTAQSASIATVSGATYTSDAYRTSLQAALDRAKA